MMNLRIMPLAVIALAFSATSNAAIIHDTGTPDTYMSPYLRANYYDENSPYLKSPYVRYSDFQINQRMNLDSIQYYALGTSASTYNRTYIRIYDAEPSVGDLMYEFFTTADVSTYGNTFMLSKYDGGIGRPYSHVIDDLNITLDAGTYYLGISIDDDQSIYLGANELDEIAITVEGSIAPPAVVPVPAAVWLFGSGLIGLVGMARRK